MNPIIEYDWKRLGDGWLVDVSDIIALKSRAHPYSYCVYDGSVESVASPRPADPEAAFTFHKLAREQVAKCRVTWQNEARWEAENIGGTTDTCGDRIAILAHSRDTLWLSCDSSRTIKWGPSGNTSASVASIHKLHQAEQALLARGWEVVW